MCTKVIMPDEDGWAERLTPLKLVELQIHFDGLCLRYVTKVKRSVYHKCFDLSNKQSACTHNHFADKAL